MSGAIHTFKRKEKKYLINLAQYEAIVQGISSYMECDKYGNTRIDSLYYDTPDRSLICKSLEKPLYKEKLRIRSYGAYSKADTVFIEIKKKFKGIVYKRRIKMTKDGAEAFLSGFDYAEAQRNFPEDLSHPDAEITPNKIQIAKEITTFLNRYESLKPSMLISCERIAWAPLDGFEDKTVDRITFDKKISYIDLFSPQSVARNPVLGDEFVLMEIKCARAYPSWLCSLLSTLGVYPRSFSKYGNAYKRVLAHKGDVDIYDQSLGKVAIHNIPRANRLRTKEGDVLIEPSIGYEIDQECAS